MKSPRSWFGLFTPSGTPKAIVAKLPGEVARDRRRPRVPRPQPRARGLEPAVNGPEDFARFIRQERPIAQSVVREADLQPQ